MTKKKSNPFWSGISMALCADLSFILDSVWRRREFEANRLFDYKIKDDLSGADAVRRSDRRLPVFWMFPNRIDIKNPRLAVMPAGWEKFTNLFVKSPATSVSINRADLMQLWTALHELKASFCRQPFERLQQQDIANWICGMQDPPLPPDLHIAQSQTLVQAVTAKS